MGKRLYVGNLPYDADDAGLRAAFEQDGRKVERVNIVLDRETGRARGFAFVEMASDDDAKAAIAAMDGASYNGRNLRVNEAEDRRPGGPGGARGPGGPPRAAGPAGPPRQAPGSAPSSRPPFGGGAGGGGGAGAGGGAARPWAKDDDRGRHEKKGGRRKHDSEDDFGGVGRGRHQTDDDDDDEWQ